MLKELFSPIKTIKNTKKNKDVTNHVLTLIIASLMFAIATIIILIKNQVLTNLLLTGLIISTVYFAIAFVGGFIYSLLTKIIADKGTYKDSLIAVIQTALILSTGLLITSILLLIPNIGILLGLITMFFTIITGLAIFIRTMTELTGANTTQIITILIIVVVGTIIATQLILILQLISEPAMFMNQANMEQFVLDLNQTP